MVSRIVRDDETVSSILTTPTVLEQIMPFVTLAEKQKYQRDHYAKNRTRYSERKKASRSIIYQKLKQLVLDAKKDGCVECKNEFRPWVLQFDHVKGKKLHNIADMIGQYLSEETILVEIAKCEVVCANCHADRTHRRR